MEGVTLIDARAAIRQETGGVERWAREMASRLPLIRPSGYEVATPPAALAHRLGQPWEQVVLPLKARQLGAAAILCPANLAPLASKRAVTVIHDAAPLRFPQDFSRAYTAWQQFLLPRLVRNSLAVITPSDFSRQELIELFDADPDRVHAIHPGVPDDLLDRQARAVPGASLAVLRKHGITTPYVLTVASHVKRKNMSALEPVAAALAERGVSLVAAGGGRPQLTPGAVPGLVKQLGAVDSDDLGQLYGGATAFVLPSVYEGFGLPVCEAMAMGVPVVCSDRASLPEAAGGAAILINPDDQDGLVSAVIEAIENDATRRRLIEKGYERVRGLTWQSTAQAVDSVVRSVVSD